MRDMPTAPAVVKAVLSPGFAKCTKSANASPTVSPVTCRRVLSLGRRFPSTTPNLTRSRKHLLNGPDHLTIGVVEYMDFFSRVALGSFTPSLCKVETINSWLG